MVEIAAKKILVTGGTGHLGSALIHCLVNTVYVKPENIRVFYLKGSPAESLADIAGLDMFAGNILSIKDVNEACKDVELIFHIAGSTTFDPRQKRMQWEINVEGTRNILEAARQSNTIEKICYTSTVNVLAPPADGTIGDLDNCSPYALPLKLHSFLSRDEILTFVEHARRHSAEDWERQIEIGYYDSKLAAQELVDDYVKKYSLNVVSLLPGTMFGPYDYLVGTGMYVLSLYHNKMPVVLGGGLPLAHVMDVAEGHVLAMEKARAGAHYILSGPEDDNRYLKDMCGIITDVLQARLPHKKFSAPKTVVPVWAAMTGAYFTELFANIFNQPMLLSRDAVKPGSYASFYTSRKAQSELGYTPKRTFRQGIEDMLEYYIQHNLLERTGRWIDKR